MNLRLAQKIIWIGIVIVTFSGCVYRLDIAQGNRIDASLIAQLEVGMSRNQVEFLMGTPAIVDLYQPDKWHYVYFFRAGDSGEIEKRHMTLTFVGDLLSAIDGRLNPV